MPNYKSPGVYIEEVDAGPKPIESVSTSIAGAVGVTARGPSTGKPELVTSWPEFVRKFGSFLPEPGAAVRNAWDTDDGGHWWRFPLAVKGFFDNGGEQLYVKRVFSAHATPASLPIHRGLVTGITADAAAAATRVRVSHLVGIDTSSSVSIVQNDAGGAVLGPFGVDAYDSTTNTIELDAAIGADVKAGRDYLVVHALGAGAAEETLRFEAASVGAWGRAIDVRIRPMIAGTNRLVASADPAIAGAASSTTLRSDAAAAATDLDVDDETGFAIGDRVLIGGREHGVTATAANTLTIDPAVPATGYGTGTVVRRIQPTWDFAGGSTTELRVWGASALYPGAIVELDNGTTKETAVVDSILGDVVTFESALSGEYYGGHVLRVIEAAVDVRYVPGSSIEAEEQFTNLRLIDDGSRSYLVTHINDRSSLVRVRVVNPANFPLLPTLTSLAGFPTEPPPANELGGWLDLGGGGDANDQLTVDDFVGTDGGAGNRTGIAALEEIDDIAICVVPGVWSGLVQSALIAHCEALKDRFAILDSRVGLSIEGVRTFKAALDSKYAALYYPWLVVRDPSVSRDVIAPPSAHMAGIYARVDNERGVHKAPANEIVRGIRRFEQDVTKREQDLLNPDGINALRFFPNRGNRVWGARTISSDGSWKYINVRRLFLMIEESIQEATAWVVFEPNDSRLWARVRQTIRNYLLTQWRVGALQGETEAQAFFIKCDFGITMTQDDIDNGRLICEIGIAPVKPAEFVIFRIQQKTLDTET